MSLLRSVGLFVCRLYGDDVSNLSPVERWAMKASKITTPDEIIGAAIIKSMAENPDDWTGVGGVPDFPKASSQYIYKENKLDRLRWVFLGTTLTNDKKDIKFKYGEYRAARDNDNCAPWFIIKTMTVNDTPLDERIAIEIAHRWKSLSDGRRKAEEIAAKAKADMERNEAAWNLVEKLLGMKRNEFGALVPVTEMPVIEEKKCRHGNKACTDKDCERDCHCE